MRDIRRIDKFCDALKEVWKKYPDLRFGQMMSNIFRQMTAENIDPFFPEDTDMLKYIQTYMDNLTSFSKEN